MEWSVIKMNWMWEDVRNINIYVHLSCVCFVIYNYLLNVTVNMCKQTVNYVQFCQDNGGSKLLLPAPVPAMLHLPLPGPARAAAEERGAGRWRLHWRDAGKPAPGGVLHCIVLYCTVLHQVVVDSSLDPMQLPDLQTDLSQTVAFGVTLHGLAKVPNIKLVNCGNSFTIIFSCKMESSPVCPKSRGPATAASPSLTMCWR